MRRNWKRLSANSMEEAVQHCIDHAQAKKRLSVKAIAPILGVSMSTIYKWAATGEIPVHRIRMFEHVCVCTYITQFLAASANLLVIKIPTGKRPKQIDMLKLQGQLTDTVTLLAGFYEMNEDGTAVEQALTNALGEIAAHRENVTKTATPELGLFDEEGEE